MKACTTCPSYVYTDEVPIVFGKAVGAPMCARYGHVLGRPGLSESGHDTLASAFALKCDSYGEERPEKAATTRGALVMEPDPKAIGVLADPSFKPDTIPTCRTCKNCVSSSTVATELGFPVDACKAKGKLILRPQNEAVGCPFAVRGATAYSTDGMALKAEYQEGYVIPAEWAVNAVTSVGDTSAEPTTYKTDVPVKPEDAAIGIRAWRKVEQPDGPNTVYLPIFSRNAFTAEEVMLIPQTGDDTHPELYMDYDHKLYRFAVDGYTLGEVVALQGLPGVGKTEFARWLAWLMQVPFHRIAFKKESEYANMIGTTQVEATENGPETKFIMGRIAKAITRIGIELFDELNLAPSGVREGLRTYFDTGEMVIDEASPVIHLEKHPYNFPLVAQNPAWDVRNVGTEELAAAEYSRLSPLAVELPPEAIERHILIERCKVDGYALPAGILDVLMRCNADLRVASEQQSVPFTWGIRESIKVARKTRWYSVPTAFKAAALDFYENQVVEFVMKIITNNTPQA